MAGASRSIVIHAPADVLFDVITDYASYPSFLSDVSSTRILEKTADGAVVEFGLNLIKKVTYSLKMVEARPNSVRWTLHESSLMKSSVGGWTLEPQADGSTKATYEVEVVPRGFVPGPVVNALTGRTLPATLEAFKTRAEARAAQL
jgi:coenzyme Q-binding protein COQ10